MKASIRWWSRLAFVAGLGFTTLAACSSDHGDKTVDEQRTGTLSLPLRTISSTGKLYFLRNAFFQIINFNTGELRILSTEDGFPDSGELTVELSVGQYQVTLLDGWFLERFDVSGGGGGGGAGGIGGTTSMGGAGGVAGKPGTAGTGPIPFPPAGEGEDSDSGTAGKSSDPAVGGEGPEDPTTGGKTGSGGTSTGTGGKAGSGGSPGGGTGPIGEPGTGEIIDARFARLMTEVTPQTQFFFVSAQSESFINYQFRVGDEVPAFNVGNLHLSFNVDDTPLCVPPDGVTRVERVMLESSENAVGTVSMRDVFNALTTNGGKAGDPDLVYNQIYDSFASAPGQIAGAQHCGDETTDGQPSLNGFRIDCDRAEFVHVNQMDDFRATAFVNRLDLAPISGAHCGQQRMIFAARNFVRSFIILEAQIPNPHPEQGIEGCRPLAQFWLDQNNIADPVERGLRLRDAFLFGGAKGLEEFPPFYTAENLTVGSGQIRVNTFNSDPWTLREFKLALDGQNLTAVPFPVAESPNGALWDETSGLPQGEACRENFLSAMDGVLTDDMSLMSFVVDAACKNSESRNDGSENYASQLVNSPNLQAQIEAKLASVGSPLSAFDVANRARFSGSCIGCHDEARGSFLGNGVVAPQRSDFPQVQDFTDRCVDDPTQQCFQTSSALRGVFLPGRLNALANTFGGEVVPNPCDGNGGSGGSTGTGGSGAAGFPTMGGGAPSGGSSSTGGKGMIPDFPGTPTPAPAPVIEIELPSADVPVAQLQEEEQEIREEYGDVTISGRSALSTH